LGELARKKGYWGFNVKKDSFMLHRVSFSTFLIHD